MNRYTVLALRVVLACGLVGSLLVQAVMVPLLAADLDDAPAGIRWPVVVIVVLGIVTIQVGMVCVWRLLTLVREDTVFSRASFRYVDTIVAAAATAAALLFALGVVLAPGEDVAPGVVLLVGGAGGLVGGVALLMVVMRSLLVQATELRAELDAVI
ncbi:MAG: transrane transport protein [Nocardioides sp.]|nr:transrane transport protein [Nocardioides sp.]